MKEIQSPQVLVKRKKLKKEETGNRKRIGGDYVEVPIYNKDKRRINEVKKSGKDLKNYSDLVLELNQVQNKCKQKPVGVVKAQRLPYEIPAVYSLEMEASVLCVMENKLNIISQYMSRTDIESISMDWKRVGGDIDHAISRYQERCVKKNG